MSDVSTLPSTSRLGAGLAHPTVYLLVILATQMMVVLDSTIVNVALPHIQASLGFTGTGLSWVLNIYVLAFGGFLLLGARAGDLLGRRRVFLAGLILFTLSSLLGGLAVDPAMLLLARALQGLGGALAAPSALSLLTIAFPEGPARTRALAMYTAVSAAGGAIGLLAGGLLTQFVNWRWTMFVNVPIGVLVAVLATVVLKETPVRTGRFDVAGALTSTLGMTALVLGLVEAGTRGWAAPLTLGPVALGVVLLGTFVRVESRAKEPVVPLRLLTNASRSGANVTRGLVYAGMFGVFFYLTQFLQDVQHHSPLRAGLAFLPMPVTVFATSQLVSRVLTHRVAPRTLTLVGVSLVGVSMLNASRIDAGASYATILSVIVLLAMGSGLSFVSLTTLSLQGVSPRDAGAASGLVNVSQQLGAAVGLAVLVNVFSSATNHAQFLPSADRTAQAEQVAVLVHGMHVVFLVGSLFAASAFLLMGFIGRSKTRDTGFDGPLDELLALEVA